MASDIVAEKSIEYPDSTLAMTSVLIIDLEDGGLLQEYTCTAFLGHHMSGILVIYPRRSLSNSFSARQRSPMPTRMHLHRRRPAVSNKIGGNLS